MSGPKAAILLPLGVSHSKISCGQQIGFLRECGKATGTYDPEVLQLDQCPIEAAVLEINLSIGSSNACCSSKLRDRLAYCQPTEVCHESFSDGTRPIHRVSLDCGPCLFARRGRRRIWRGRVSRRRL